MAIVKGFMEYVRYQYQKPWLKVGIKVMVLGREGRVIGADSSGHVRVRLAGDKRRTTFVHPGDVERSK